MYSKCVQLVSDKPFLLYCRVNRVMDLITLNIHKINTSHRYLELNEWKGGDDFWLLMTGNNLNRRKKLCLRRKSRREMVQRSVLLHLFLFSLIFLTLLLLFLRNSRSKSKGSGISCRTWWWDGRDENGYDATGFPREDKRLNKRGEAKEIKAANLELKREK